MLRYLLDTGIVSSPAAKIPDPAIGVQLARHGHASAIAAPVLHEMIYGVDRLPAGKRRDALKSYLEDVVLASFQVLPYAEAAARWHGSERARLEGQGKPAPYVDGQIAAIAYTNGLILVTTNSPDFMGFRDLRVEDWSTK